MNKNEQNLTTGSVPEKLIMFALPLLLANLLQSFYSIVDMLVVGQFVGDIGLAAISNASILILKVGLPTAIQMVVVNISYLLITGMLNQYGV